MSERDDGGPAFPSSEELVGVDSQGYKTTGHAVSHGMSLRDYIAVRALQGMIASDPDYAKADRTDRYTWATFAYAFAEAMLEVRKSTYLTEPPKSG